MKRVWGQGWLSLGLSPPSCKTLRCPSPTGEKMIPPTLKLSAGKSCTDQRIWGGSQVPCQAWAEAEGGKKPGHTSRERLEATGHRHSHHWGAAVALCRQPQQTPFLHFLPNSR